MEKYRFTCRRELHGFPLPLPEGEMFFGRDWGRRVQAGEGADILNALADSYPLYSPERIRGNLLRLTLSPSESVLLGYELIDRADYPQLWPMESQVLSAVST